MNFSSILQLLFAGVNIGSIYALVAIGFNIIYNTTGIVNFAQGEFVMLGGMTMASLWMTAHLPLPLSFIATIIIVTSFGILLEWLCIRPVRKASVIILIMITIACSIIIRGISMFIWGKDARYMNHFSGETPIPVLGASLLPQTLWILGTLALVVVLLAFFFRSTLTGKAMRACSVDREAAQLMGIPAQRMVMISFALSAAIGAVGGVVVTPLTLMNYGSAMLGLKGFGAAVLGGMGNFWGAVVAGLLLGAMESLSAGLLTSHYKDAIALIILLLVLSIRPSGLFVSKEAGRLKEF